jgi:hypothetical protein
MNDKLENLKLERICIYMGESEHMRFWKYNTKLRNSDFRALFY